MSDFQRMGPAISESDLTRMICWDDGDDPKVLLASGAYETCAGEWRRETDGRWQFYKDPTVEI